MRSEKDDDPEELKHTGDVVLESIDTSADVKHKPEEHKHISHGPHSHESAESKESLHGHHAEHEPHGHHDPSRPAESHHEPAEATVPHHGDHTSKAAHHEESGPPKPEDGHEKKTGLVKAFAKNFINQEVEKAKEREEEKKDLPVRHEKKDSSSSSSDSLVIPVKRAPEIPEVKEQHENAPKPAHRFGKIEELASKAKSIVSGANAKQVYAGIAVAGTAIVAAAILAFRKKR